MLTTFWNWCLGNPQILVPYLAGVVSGIALIYIFDSMIGKVAR